MNAKFHTLIRHRRRKIESIWEKNAENYVWTWQREQTKKSGVQ